VAHIRARLAERQVLTAAAVRSAAADSYVTVAGLVTHRQQPPTARGVVFLSLEDETGMVNVICPPQVWARHRRMATVAPALLIQGRIERTGGAGPSERSEGTERSKSTERTDGAVNLVAAVLRPLRVAAVPSRDFR